MNEEEIWTVVNIQGDIVTLENPKGEQIIRKRDELPPAPDYTSKLTK